MCGANPKPNPKFICIHFAMGNCTHGPECKYNLPLQAQSLTLSLQCGYYFPRFLHRLPTLEDEKHIRLKYLKYLPPTNTQISTLDPNPGPNPNLSMLHDVFGRERHHEHRDDMGGVGSPLTLTLTLALALALALIVALAPSFSAFSKNTRTLYITGCAVMKSPQVSLREARRARERERESQNPSLFLSTPLPQP